MPWLGKTKETEQWSETQIITFAVTSYLTIAASIAILTLEVHNFVRYIVSCPRDEVTKALICQAQQPLLVFYLLVACSLCTDIFFSVMIVQMENTYAPFLSYLPPMWKVLIGLDQVWLLFEFIVNMRLTINLSQRGVR